MVERFAEAFDFAFELFDSLKNCVQLFQLLLNCGFRPAALSLKMPLQIARKVVQLQ